MFALRVTVELASGDAGSISPQRITDSVAPPPTLPAIAVAAYSRPRAGSQNVEVTRRSPVSHFVSRPAALPHWRPHGGIPSWLFVTWARVSWRCPFTARSCQRISLPTEPSTSSEVMNCVAGAPPNEVAGTIVNAAEPSGSLVWVPRNTVIGTTGTEQSYSCSFRIEMTCA